jgi:L-asparaginase/Glu-tRNA(Gln) amidotransferase subunit D
MTVQQTPEILVIMSGGTIDAEPYAETPNRVTPLSESKVPKMVADLGYADQCAFYQWMMKDSQDFSADEICQLAKIIRDSGYKKVMVTHGTDAMVKNAGIVQEELHGTDIDVRFVGAMEPLSHGERSDGSASLRVALEDLLVGRAREKNVYIVGRGMQQNGQLAAAIYDPATTAKDRERKIFVDTQEHAATRGR